MRPAAAFVGLGANLGDPAATLRSAVRALRELPDTSLVALSSLYRSAPLGPAGQPDYLNAVARLDTRLAPHALLQALQDVESRHGRIRQERWGPRTLDLDLLLYDRDVIVTVDLTLPHPELCRRNFVLLPLLQLAPELTLPDGTRLATLPAAQDQAGLSELAPAWAD